MWRAVMRFGVWDMTRHAASECVPLLRHKSKAKVGSEVQSRARAIGGGVMASEGGAFEDADAEGVM